MDAPAQVSISDVDAVTPDFVRGERETLPMAALVTNPTTAPVSLLNHRWTIPPLSGIPWKSTAMASVPKVSFRPR